MGRPREKEWGSIGEEKFGGGQIALGNVGPHPVVGNGV